MSKHIAFADAAGACLEIPLSERDPANCMLHIPLSLTNFCWLSNNASACLRQCKVHSVLQRLEAVKPGEIHA